MDRINRSDTKKGYLSSRSETARSIQRISSKLGGKFIRTESLSNLPSPATRQNPDNAAVLFKVNSEDFENMSIEQLSYLVKKSVNSSKRNEILKSIPADTINPENIQLFLTVEQISEFQEIFGLLDEDNSKEVSYSELKKAFGDMDISVDVSQLKKMISEIDKDSSGSIDFDEFATLLLRIEIGLQNDALKKTKEEVAILNRKKSSLQRSKIVSTNQWRLVSETQHIFEWQSVFYNTFKESSKPLLMVFLVLCISLVLTSSVLYFSDDQFSSIPGTFWYVISTFVTVGYGDIAPRSSLGKLFGSITTIIGLLVLAVPISVISTNFNSEYDRMIKKESLQKSQRKNLQNIQMDKHGSGKSIAKKVQALNDDLLTTSMRRLIEKNQKRMLLELEHRNSKDNIFLLSELKKISEMYFMDDKR